jgi:hypothetical protein
VVLVVEGSQVVVLVVEGSQVVVPVVEGSLQVVIPAINEEDKEVTRLMRRAILIKTKYSLEHHFVTMLNKD